MLNLGIGLGLSGGAGGAGVVLGASEFYAPLTHSLVLTRGTGDPTYSRATASWEFDNEGKLILVPSGAARFGGARMVRNLVIGSSADFSNAAWTKDSGITADAGGLLTSTLTQANAIIPATSYSFIIDNVYTFSFTGKAGTKPVFQVGVPAAVATSAKIANFDLANGVTGTVTAGVTASMENLGGGYYRCQATFTATATISHPLYLTLQNTANSSYYAASTAGTIEVRDIQFENVTGQADQTASEYISVGVLSAPWHGAGADGCKWFNTNKDGSAISASSLLGYHAEGARTNSLLYSRDLTKSVKNANSWWIGSGIATGATELFTNADFSSATGWVVTGDWVISGGQATIVATQTSVLRQDVLTAGKAYIITFTIVSGSFTGYIYFGSGTYKSLSSIGPGTYSYYGRQEGGAVLCQIQAFTGCACTIDNISVKEAAMQVSTCTGIDNAADSASTLTAGAADATILQTLTLAAAARSFSAYVKRRTGTGNVYITRNGGTSWTDITSSLGASWTRVKIENTSVLNPQVGFKIATSGDAIDVDCTQDEAGAEAWSPIVTTTAAVTRNADAETFPTASNWSDTAGWALATVQGESWANATGTAIGNGTNGLKLSASNSGIVAYDGTNTVNGPAGSPSGAEKLAMTWGSGALQSASGGVAGSAGSYDGAWGLATVGIGTSQGNVYIKDVYIGQSALTADQLAQVTS